MTHILIHCETCNRYLHNDNNCHCPLPAATRRARHKARKRVENELKTARKNAFLNAT